MTYTPTATIESDDSGITVRTTWSGDVDRKDGIGWGFAPNKMALALRLVRAVNDGVVFGTPEVLTDINGKTYINADKKVMGKYANADLNRLGY